MSLRQWKDNGWLKPEPSSRNEIHNLFVIIERDMKDSMESVSVDWQFGIAYNAALKLCTVLLRAEGYRTTGGNHHYRTITALPEILGSEWKSRADYLNACRMKRNTLEYDYAGCVTGRDVEELLDFLEVLKREVLEWLETEHSDLSYPC